MVEGSKYSKRGVAIAISILLILTISPPLVINQVTKSQIRDELEQASFIVDRVDILRSSNSKIIVNGSVDIQGLNLNNYDDVNIISISLILKNDSEILPEVEIPLDNQNLESKVIFEIELLINNNNKNENLTSKILTNILVGYNFTLHFDATVKYQSGPFRGSLSFSNILQFQLKQEAVTVELKEIQLSETNQGLNNITFEVTNPFTATMSLQGDVNVETDTLLGIMQLDRVEFPTGAKTVSGIFDLLVNQVDLYQKVLNSIDTGIILTSDLILGLKDLEVSISPELKLLPPSSLLNFSITSIEELVLDFEPPSAYVNASANITSFLPLTLELEFFSSEIYTLGNSELGDLVWNNSIIRVLDPYRTLNFENITLRTSILNFVDISSVLLNGEIELRDIRLGLNVLDDFYIFTIPNQALNVVSSQ